jgi:membrane protein YdbS with pleckstrin-like domain
VNCPTCDGVVEADSRFCKHCGKTLTPWTPTAAGLGPNPPTGAVGASAKRPDVYHDPKEEQQVWQGRPAWRSYYGHWAAWAIFGAVTLGAAYKWTDADSMAVFLAWAFVLGAGVALLVREALVVLSLRYRLTTQRLFVHRGILSRVTDQMELMRVDDVRLHQTVVDRLVNTGSVEIHSSDETDEVIVLQSVSSPAEVAEALRLHVRGIRSKGALMIEQI